ncbi:MAG: hypothetical protein J6125_02530 [Clostridia bacterium]|nr:hypothetical protein [Clostridia bacterium]
MSNLFITPSEVDSRKVASLPANPNASPAFGGRGYTSAQLRAAFDALPLLLVERFNALVTALGETGEESVAAMIPTGLTSPSGEDVPLSRLFGDISDGTFATYLKVGASYLDLILAALAPLDSPALSGAPTASTPSSSDDSSRIATTAWVRDLVERYETLYLAILEGRDGNVPGGGGAGLVLSKRSDDDFDVEWASLSDFAFGSPTAVTPQTGDNSTKVATTAFVAAAVSAMRSSLLGGAGEAYDTLKEIADALSETDGDVAEALSLIASKESKTTFVYVTPGANNEVEIAVLSDHDYRAASFEATSLSLTFPLAPEDGFIASFSFSTPDDADITLSYTNMPDSYATGDDCAGGVFVPARGATYTVVVWYEEYPAKYQWVVRKSG